MRPTSVHLPSEESEASLPSTGSAARDQPLPLLRQSLLQSIHQAHCNLMHAMSKCSLPHPHILHQVSTQLKAMRSFPDATTASNFTLPELQALKLNLISARAFFEDEDIIQSASEALTDAITDILDDLHQKRDIQAYTILGVTYVLPSSKNSKLPQALEWAAHHEKVCLQLETSFAHWDASVDTLMRTLSNVPTPEAAHPIPTVGPQRMRVARSG